MLLIITDGVITDYQETIDRLVQASTAALSVVIVGVGNANFSKMDVLDADQKKLIDSKGRPATRDAVQVST